MTTNSRQGATPKKPVPELGGHDAALHTDEVEPPERLPLGREALEVATSWAVIGIFMILGFGIVHYMSLILIPLTLAVVVGLILGLAADRLGRAGMPRFATAVLLSSLVAAVFFFIVNSLAQPVATLVREGPSAIERTINRILPYLERQQWLNISPASFDTGPMSVQSLIENSSNILGVLTASLTPAIIQALIFFGALLLFLYGRLKLRRTIILAFPTRRQRLVAIRVLNSIDHVLGYYFATATLIYLALGVSMALIAYFGGLAMPVLWAMFAFLSSFIPFLGITLMTISVAVAGILTHEALILGLIPAAVFFSLHLVMENLIFPAVMGRQWEINPFLVFVAILFWTWMWGAVGAMLALPLSLIMMTVLNELFPERKTVPHLPG
ncbi:AI-2E family transporter [Rhizobium sp. LC145]|uniref:AI-2E family transporter n=1 Tax=Rhizobium sp. LC145 TaxID=1120688 RepID=UPI000629E8ED|nr:AI-2E family transporter [Rhizobium sp. LC145]KKX28109.1 permease [Rhizobium sp. LC145]TKT54457.1 AI-2E family transporter [Rhizobiaceae bacterium LC148]